MKVLLARKDVTLSSMESAGIEPTSRIIGAPHRNCILAIYLSNLFYDHMQIRLNMYTISMKPEPIIVGLSFSPFTKQNIISIINAIRTVVITLNANISLTPLACNKQSNHM